MKDKIITCKCGMTQFSLKYFLSLDIMHTPPCYHCGRKYVIKKRGRKYYKFEIKDEDEIS